MDEGSILPGAAIFFAFVPDTGTEDFVCESDVGGGGLRAGRGRAGGGRRGITAKPTFHTD